MTDWATLHDAYGSATDIPARINTWVEQPTEHHLTELWIRLCHQGSVYSASFAAIPLLHGAFARLASKDRRSALMLIGAILAAADQYVGSAPDAAIIELVPSLAQLTDVALGEADVRADEFPYLLQAAATFNGDTFWGRNFGNFAGGEFLGVCPHCNADLFLVIGKYGYFAASEDWVSKKDARQTPITPSSKNQLPPDGAFLFEQANRHARHDAEVAVLHIFGRSMCPSCDGVFSVADAIKLVPAA